MQSAVMVKALDLLSTGYGFDSCLGPRARHKVPHCFSPTRSHWVPAKVQTIGTDLEPLSKWSQGLMNRVSVAL